MTSQRWAIVASFAAIALTLAQDVRPGLDWYHSWQYAAILALLIVVIAAYAWGARDGADGANGRRIALACAGALVVAIAGLASGLIGPDTVTVFGSPGTAVSVADIGATAVFGPADPAAIAAGTAAIGLRTGNTTVPVPAHGHRYLGTSVVTRTTRPAAYVVARDTHGNHLTVTQPNNATFLSPVLLFPNEQALRDKSYPFDTFATPAIHRIIRALYFSAGDTQTFNHTGIRQSALVLSVNDDDGKSIGLTIVSSGHPVTVGNLVLTVTLGTYPQLSIASAPPPAALAVGLLLFAGGLGATAFVRRPPAPIEVAVEEEAVGVVAGT